MDLDFLYHIDKDVILNDVFLSETNNEFSLELPYVIILEPIVINYNNFTIYEPIFENNLFDTPYPECFDNIDIKNVLIKDIYPRFYKRSMTHAFIYTYIICYEHLKLTNETFPLYVLRIIKDLVIPYTQNGGEFSEYYYWALWLSKYDIHTFDQIINWGKCKLFVKYNVKNLKEHIHMDRIFLTMDNEPFITNCKNICYMKDIKVIFKLMEDHKSFRIGYIVYLLELKIKRLNNKFNYINALDFIVNEVYPILYLTDERFKCIMKHYFNVH